MSSEAKSVYNAANSVVDLTDQSVALFGDKAAALSRLAELLIECRNSGWDGGDAAAIDFTAAVSVERFVRALPDGVPLPEFAPEPDGSISLDWIQSRNRLLSISVGRGNRLAYAWLDGSNKGHAVVGFDGHNIPSEILDKIEDIMGHGYAGLRVA